MTKRIVIPLRRHDRIEQTLPYLEKIAQPGMKVVFLIPYPVESWSYREMVRQLFDAATLGAVYFSQSIIPDTLKVDHGFGPTAQSPSTAMLARREIMHAFSWELQRRLAEGKIAAAREALRKLQVDVAVHVYTGSLRKLLAAYKDKEEARLIMRPLTSSRFWQVFVNKISLLGFLKRPRSVAVVLMDV